MSIESEAKPDVVDFATDWDHTDPAWVHDPYPIWEDLRGRCPVAHTDRYGGRLVSHDPRDGEFDRQRHRTLHE